MFDWKLDDEIRLRLITDKFAPDYVRLCAENREYLSEWLEWPRFCVKEEDFLAFIKKSLHDFADGKSLVCAIEFKGQVVGNISYNKIEPRLKRVEIGYWLAEGFQGRGIMTRSCRYLIDHAFQQLNMQKVQIRAAEGNYPSRAVCERLGMKLEGIISNEELVGDRILNHAIYALHRG